MPFECVSLNVIGFPDSLTRSKDIHAFPTSLHLHVNDILEVILFVIVYDIMSEIYDGPDNYYDNYYDALHTHTHV